MFFAAGNVTFAQVDGEIIEEFPANITRTGWEMHRSEYVQSLGFNLDSRQDLRAYDLADIPGIDPSNWDTAPDPYIIGFAEKSRISGKDGNNGCKSAVDYSYFQTFVNIPDGVDVTEFTIRFSGIDEGARVSIFNSDHNGLVPDSYVYLDTSGEYPGGQLVNLVDYVASGENRVVVTQVDNCPATDLGNLLESAEISLDGIETIRADAFILQAVTSATVSDAAVVRARISGEAGDTIPTLEVLTSDSCSGGALGSDATVFGELVVGDNADNVLVEGTTSSDEYLLDSNGDAFLEGGIVSDSEILRYASVRVQGTSGIVGETSYCIVAGPDNDSWIRAAEIELTPDPGSTSKSYGDIDGYIDIPGKSRWFKFAIQPGARARIDLKGLPTDYDVAVFKDITQAFVELFEENDVDGLNKLGAEFAPSMFSPSMFSPSMFSPSMFSPDAYAPSMFSPSMFSPSMFSPSMFSPSIFSPSMFSPSMFSPSMFSPSMFSPSMFSPSMFSPSMFSPSMFSEDNYASAQIRSLISVSAQPGTVSERVIADTWSNTGYYYVRVTGKNGANDVEDSFQLSVSLDGVDCAGVSPIGGTISASYGGYQSILLWDSVQLLNSGSTQEQIAAMEERLNVLAQREEVNGVVVDLGSFTHIQDLHTQADANASCPYAANLTAQAIKEVIEAYQNAGNPLRYVVLAGGDSEIPFFRYPDQGLLGPEQNYEPPMADGTQSQSSLRLNYILSQDEYGASTSLSLNDGQFPLPELAVGRLVESVPEMITMINAYLSTGAGVIDTPDSTLVTGYDFLTDVATAIQTEFELGTIGARNDELITDATISPQSVCSGEASSSCSWTASQLSQELLAEGEDIIFLAGHFSANSALAADYETSLLSTQLAASDVDLTNSLVFSAGCHSGYNIVDNDGVEGLTEPLDWTQAFAQKGATLIAGTGYQYGDTDFIEYSERLYLLFARELRSGSGPVSVGEALVKAKHDYLSTTPDIRGLHRKSLLISTLFGLPMLSLDMPGERIPDDIAEQALAAPVASGPGLELGLSFIDLPLSFVGELQLNEVDLSNVSDQSTIVATYLSGPDGVVANPAEPTLPLLTLDVSAVDAAGSALSLRGVGFLGGQWEEYPVVPFTGAPVTELRGVHTPFSSLVNFPMRLATPNFYGAITQSGGINLHVTPAQHRIAEVGDYEAILRQFNDLDIRLYYSNNTQTYEGNTPALASPPSMTRVQAVLDGADVVFFVNVVGAPSAGIQEVWVTYTDGGQSFGEWISLDLSQDPLDSTLWSGRLIGGGELFSRLDFMVQAVNGVGLVSQDDNYGRYYQLQNSGDAPSSLTLYSPYNELTYGDTLEGLMATLTDGEGNAVYDAPVLFTIGATTRLARTDASGTATVSLPLNATPPEEYILHAYFPGNEIFQPANSEQLFTITKVDTLLNLTGPQEVGVDDQGYGFTAELKDAHGNPLIERTVYFTILGTLEGDVTLPVITDNTGAAMLSADVLNLTAGTYTVEARFLGMIPTGSAPYVTDSPLYYPSSSFHSFTVNKQDTFVSISGPSVVRADQSISGFSATLTDDNGTPLAGRSLSLILGDYSETALTNSMGVASFSTLPAMAAGTYTVSSFFDGDSTTYNGSEATHSLTVNKVDTLLSMTGPEVVRADQPISGFTATLTDDYGMPLPGRELSFELGDYSLVVTTDNMGMASFSTSFAIAAGSYALNVSFDGDSTTYNPTSAFGTFSVTRVNTVLSVDGPETLRADEAINGFSALLTDDHGMPLPGRNISFTVGEISGVVMTNGMGVANFSAASALASGNYTLTASFDGDVTTYLGVSAVYSFTVNKVFTTLTLSGPDTLRADQPVSGFSVTLTDDYGMPLPGRDVSFALGDYSEVVTTDSMGVADLSSLAPISAGDYVLTANFYGDATTYNPTGAYLAFTVSKLDTSLVLDSATQIVGVEGVESGISATLTDDNGLALEGYTVNFIVTGGPEGNRTIPVITDVNGVARLGELALPAKSYGILANFLGDSSTYNASSANTTLNLLGGENCPTSDTKGKISVSGFCYLTHRVDGKIAITDGTLIVGNNTEIIDSDTGETITYEGFVDQKIEQFGEGSVYIYASARVRGMIVETGPGHVIVSGEVGEDNGSGKVGGQVDESGDGDVIVNVGGIVYGNVGEQNAGSVIIAGTVEGNIFESGEGMIDILSSGIVTGGLQQD